MYSPYSSLVHDSELISFVHTHMTDDQRKKEVEILLLDADMNKLKYEIVYRDEKEREKGFNFNRYLRNSKRIEMNEATVRATNF